MDLKKGQTNMNFLNFINGNHLFNSVLEPTRIADRFFQGKNILVHSETLIDVVLHNSDLIKETKVIDCTFSDHNYVVTKLNLIRLAEKPKRIIGRNISSKNLNRIKVEIEKCAFRSLSYF